MGHLRRGPARATLCCLSIGFYAWAGAAQAPPEDVKSTLARPLSPGAVALLFEHAAEPSVRARWAEALKDSRPAVRAAAARVINITGARAWLDELQAALAAENDQDAAEEEVLALGVLAAASADERLLAAATRLGGGVPRTLAETWARVRGIDALRSLPALRSAGLKSSDLWNVFVLATRNGTENLTRAGIAAVRDDDTASWERILQLARRPRADLDPGLIAAALGTTSDAMHAATYFHLALLTSDGTKLPGVPAALVEDTLQGERPKDLAASLTLELLARCLGRKPIEQSAWIAALGKTEPTAPYAQELVLEPVLLMRLTKGELSTLSRTVKGDPDELPNMLRWVKELKARTEADTTQNVIRSVDRFPRGFVDSVLAVTDCRPNAARGIGIAAISYGVDGRPRAVAVAEPEPGATPLGKPPQCQDAARLLLAMSLAPSAHATGPGVEETLLVLLNPQGLACLAESDNLEPPASTQNAGVRQHIVEPKRIKNVDPVYPEPARQARIQGAVVLRALISSAGCVRSLEVTASNRALNWAAMSAVSQWRYSPALLNGAPVPVDMTVTINFRLN
jgi:TonB family protein